MIGLLKEHNIPEVDFIENLAKRLIKETPELGKAMNTRELWEELYRYVCDKNMSKVRASIEVALGVNGIKGINRKI